MTTAYTSLLGLALPVTGELSGTWGDTVNTAITSLLDSAVAGTTSITTDADITLTTTTGASNEARQAIILWNPASGTTTRNITAPAQSKIYTVINASGGTQSIVIRGVGPTTGVTIAKGESATVAWNGSDFVKVGSSGGAATFTNLTVTGNTILGDAAADTVTVNGTVTSNLIFTDNTYDIGASGATRPRTGYFGTSLITPLVDATNVEVTNIKALDGTASITLANSTGVASFTANPVLSGGTANGVSYLNGSKVLTTGSALTFDGTTLSVVGRLYNGSASTFGASTWGMSLGNGGVSANYFKASTTYWQDDTGTQIAQLSSGNLEVASATAGVGFSAKGSATGTNVDATTSRGGVLNLYNTSATDGNTSAIGFFNSNNLTSSYISGVNISHSGRVGALVFGVANGAAPTELARFIGTGQFGVGFTPAANNYLIQSNSGVRAGTSVVAQGSLQGYTGAGIFLSYESTYGRLESYDYGASAWKNIAVAPNGGYIGIGTTAPVALLNVVSGTNTTLSVPSGVVAQFKGSVVINSLSTASSGTVDSLYFQKSHTSGINIANYDLGIIKSFTGNGYTGGFDFYTSKNTGGGTYAATFAMRIDELQNVGVQVVPATWASDWSMVQVGSLAGFGQYSGTASTMVTYNYYNSGTGGSAPKYLANGYASVYQQASGYHYWYSAPSNSSGAGAAITDFTQVLSVRRNESLALQGGYNYSGTGITFPATQSASSNANTLDDYEEGTFTPALQGGSGAGTWSPSYNTGFYTKVGRTVNFTIVLGGTLSGASGNLLLTGMPFTVSGGGQGTALAEYRYLNITGYNQVGIEWTDTTTYGYFYMSGISKSESQIAVSNWSSGGTSIIWVTGSYNTAT